MMILVQTIPARSFPKQIGNKPITSAYFNNHSQILVVGCMDLSIFVPDLEKEELIKYVFTYLRGLNHKQEKKLGFLALIMIGKILMQH